MKLKEKLIVYCYKKINAIELEKEQILQQRRYQAMDSLDMYENMRAEIRISTINEIMTDILNIILHCK